MQYEDKINRLRRSGTLAVLFGGFLAYGLTVGTSGPILPRIGDTFGASYTALSLLVTLMSMGYSAGVFLGGMAADRYTPRTPFATGAVIAAAAVGIMPLTGRFWVVAVGFFLIKFGFGMMEAGANNQMVGLNSAKPAMLMTWMHLFFGVGSSLGALYAGRALGWGLSWSTVLALCGILPVAVCISSLSVRPVPARVRRIPENVPATPTRRLLLRPEIILLAGILAFAVAVEVGAVSWLSAYLQQGRGKTLESATWVLTAFLMAFTLGRLVLGWVAERLGYLRFMLLAMLAAALTGAAACLVPGGVWLFTVMGFAVSPMFPVVVTTVSRIFPHRAGTSMGLVTSLNGIANMGLQMLIGGAADRLGIGTGMLLVPVFALLGGGLAATLLIRMRGRLPDTAEETTG